MRLFYCMAFCAITTVLNAQTLSPDYVDGAIYLQLKDAAPVNLRQYDSSDVQLNLIMHQYGIGEIIYPFDGLGDSLKRTCRMRFSDTTSVDAMLAALNSLSYVQYAEKIPMCYTNFEPDDKDAQQYHLDVVDAARAWDVGRGNSNMTVAIVDNGVLLSHEDLQSVLWTNPGEVPNNGIDDDLNGYVDDVHGYDVADEDGNPNPPANVTSKPEFSHGTHCAGIAGAATNNGRGVASIGFGISIMAVKCAPDNSEGNQLNTAYEGISYAVTAGANVVSMSFSGRARSLTGDAIIRSASSRGVVLIAAAGNSNKDSSFYPVAYSEVIGVGASDANDKRAGFSNFGQSVDVMAPGVNIISCLATSNNAYGQLSGTSMACPMVAGLAGLVLSNASSLSPAQVKNRLTKGAKNIDGNNPGFEGKLGAGRINAFNSISNISGLQAPPAVEHSLFIAQSILNIQLSNASATHLTIYNTTGQQLISVPTQGQQVQIDLSSIPHQVLIVQLQMGEKLVAEKVVW